MTVSWLELAWVLGLCVVGAVAWHLLRSAVRRL